MARINPHFCLADKRYSQRTSTPPPSPSLTPPPSPSLTPPPSPSLTPPHLTHLIPVLFQISDDKHLQRLLLLQVQDGAAPRERLTCSAAAAVGVRQAHSAKTFATG